MKKKNPSPVPKSPPLVPRSKRTSLVLGAAAFLSLGTACASDSGESDSDDPDEAMDKAPQVPPESGAGGAGAPQVAPTGGDTHIPPQVAPTGGAPPLGTGGTFGPQVPPSGGYQEQGVGGAGAPQVFPGGGYQEQGAGGHEQIPPQPSPGGGDGNEI